MTLHLSGREVADYAHAALSADDLLRVDDHLAACADCRARVGAAADSSTAALRDVLTSGGSPLEHLSYEQLEAYVDEGLDARDRATVEAHVEVCATCAEDLSDLRAVAGVRAERPVARWLGLAAAGAAAAGLAGWFLLGGAPPPTGVSDGERVATVVPPNDPIAPDDREAIAEALRTGTMPVPADVRDLRGQVGVLMAPGARGGVYRPLRPIGTAVRSAQPIFEWTPVEEGASYTVSVFTEDLEKVAEGVVGSGTTWAAPQLPAGRRFLWQVRARAGGREILIPQPPLPQARFRTLTEDEGRLVAGAEERYASQPLALAIAYARAGLIDDARATLQSLAAADPQSSDVQRLLASLSLF